MLVLARAPTSSGHACRWRHAETSQTDSATFVQHQLLASFAAFRFDDGCNWLRMGDEPRESGFIKLCKANWYSLLERGCRHRPELSPVPTWP